MGHYYGLVVLVGGVALCLTMGRCSDSCRGRDGEPGVKGAPGRDGLHGAKGEKGEPAVASVGPVDEDVLLMLKGEAGTRGPQGPIGLKGFRGELGPMGQPGQPGLPGPDGRSHGGQAAQRGHSAFSVIRTDRTYPPYNQPLTFQKIVVNKPGDFNKDTGYFTCSVPGVYYFTFHSVARVSTCLRIANDALPAAKQPGFCDYHGKNVYDQVLSGGVVLRLAAGKKVWLLPFKENQADADRNDMREKQVVFSGFLLFPDAE